MSGSGLATTLAVAAGLAGSVQVALMSRLGERIGVFQALGFATLVTAVLAFVLLLATRRSAAGYERALHQPWWMLMGGLLLVSVGIIGEYLIRIIATSEAKPTYFVRRRSG